MLKKIYTTFIAVLITQAMLFGQGSNTSSLLKAARKEYQSLKYANTIKLLVRELKDHPTEIEAQEMIANSYRNVKDYDKAVYWYSELTKNADIKPQWALSYAEALANKQQYESSELWYRKYVELVNKDKMASSFAKSYTNMDAFLKNRKAWKIGYLNINTAAAEYSPLYYKDGLMFTSNRKYKGIVKRVFEWDKTPFSDLYYVQNLADIKAVNADSLQQELHKNGKGLKKGYKENDDDTYPTSNDSRVLGTYNLKLLNDTLGDYLSSQVAVETVPGKVNSKYHEGPAALLPDGSVIFTRNNYFKGDYKESKEGVNKLKLYTAKAPDWNNIEPFAYNNDQYSVGHPTVNKAGTILIFTSDMPGGLGGTDLYYCKRATVNDAWDKPVNMGPVINTEGNEMFPVLHQDSTLYFSSTGHAGLGGLDIFQVALNGVEPLGEPINIGSPINSSVDDFGLIRSEDGSTGYFSSNRKGSDDIYSFTHHDFQIMLQGLVVDSLSGQPVGNSTITMLPQGTNNVQTDSQGKFSSMLKTETDYQLTAAKNGYNPAAGAVSSKGINSDTTLTITLKIGQKPQLKAIPAFNCDSVKQLLTIGKIYYDLDKSFIRKDAVEALTHLLSILKAYPTLKVVVASYCDSRASKKYNVGLSLRRSTSARAYLLKHGISASRITIEYFGETHLVNKCTDNIPCSEADQQLNRRSEFFLIRDGKKLQDMDCDWLQTNFENNKK